MAKVLGKNLEVGKVYYFGPSKLGYGEYAGINNETKGLRFIPVSNPNDYYFELDGYIGFPESSSSFVFVEVEPEKLYANNLISFEYDFCKN